nr:hypothetical protein 15 [bacterium]
MASLTAYEIEELAKCKRSPIYFLDTYGFIRDPIKGKMPFKLYRFQQIALGKFLQSPFNLILKCRQMGLSWLVAGYALWLTIFFEDKKVLMISIKDATAKALLKKVRYLYNHLPPFMQPALVEDNMSKMSFVTDSEIESVPTSEEAGRSESLSLLIIDEAAFVRWIEGIWQASFPTLSTGGSAIILSTPNGMDNFFYELWNRSLEGKSLFTPIRIHWWYHPERNRKWLEIQKANMSTMQLAQEVYGDFVASGNLVFDVEALRVLQEECAMIAPAKTFYTNEVDPDFPCGLYQYERVRASTDYIMCVDPAKGGAVDYHAAHVIESETGKQVAEYRTRIPLDEFNQRIFKLGTEYNYALAAIENNNMGIATNLHFKNHDYPNVYEYTSPLKPGQADLGFPTNTLTRPLLIDELDKSIREGVSGVQGIRTVNELLSFAWSRKGKAEAQTGKHDDLVISLGIGRYVRQYGARDVDFPVFLG